MKPLAIKQSELTSHLVASNRFKMKIGTLEHLEMNSRKVLPKLIYRTIPLLLLALNFLPVTLDAQPNQKGLKFTGDAYAKVSSYSNIDIENKNITVEFWVKHDGSSDKNAIIIGNKETGPFKKGFSVKLMGNSNERKVKFAPGKSNGHITSRQGLEKGRWYHIAAVYDNSNPAIYINGQLDNSSNGRTPIRSSSLPLVIGSDAQRQGNYFHGSLDEVRIWNKPLTQLEVESNFKKELTGNESGLVAYFKMNSKSGSKIVNNVQLSAANDGSLVGSYSLGEPGALPIAPIDVHAEPSYVNDEIKLEWEHPSYAASQVNQYTVFRSFKNGQRQKIATVNPSKTTYIDKNAGVDSLFKYEVRLTTNSNSQSDYSEKARGRITNYSGLKFTGEGSLKITKTASIKNIMERNRLTIDFWMKHDGKGNQDAFIIGNKESEGDFGFALKLVELGKEKRIKFVPDRGGNFSNHLLADPALEQNRWYHITVSFVKGQSKIFINGKEVASNDAKTNDLSSKLPFVIGSNAKMNDNYFNGTIDELRIWNKGSLKPKDLMKQKFIGKEQGLVGYYRFNESTVSNIIHSSARPFPGNLSGDYSLSTRGSRPAAPVNVHARPHEGAIEIKAESPDYLKHGITGFTIYRSESGGNTWQKLGRMSPQDSIYTDKSAKDSTMYEYRVTLTDSSGRESDSSQITHAAIYPYLAGKALQFSGNNSYAQIKKTPSYKNLIDDQAFTFDFWMKRGGNSDNDAIIFGNKQKPDDRSGILLKLKESNNETELEFWPGGGGGKISIDSSIIVDKWYHVTIFFKLKKYIEVFINGNKAASSNKRRNPDLSTSLPFVIGSNPQKNGKFFNGAIDELRIWNTVNLKPSELMKEHEYGDEKGLIGYWRFNEGSGNNIRSSARPLPGSLNNVSFINSPVYGKEAPAKAELIFPVDSAKGVSKKPDFLWSQLNTAQSYQLQLSTTKDFSSKVVDKNSLKDSSYTITNNLQFGTRYFWRVRGIGSSNGNWSETRTFKTRKAPLPLPGKVTLTAPNNMASEIDPLPEFQWNNANNTSSYEIQVSKDDAFGNTVIEKNAFATGMLTNDGSGNFSQAEAGIGGIADGSVALGDLNGDSHVDVIAIGKYKTMIYLNDGSGEFSKTQTDIKGASNPDVELGDLNGDSHLDVLVTGDSTTRAYFNDGSGNFNTANAGLDGLSNGMAALGDLNGDSHLDIMVAGDDKAQLYFNDGSGNFSLANAGLSGGANGNVALGDLNGDSHLDVLIGSTVEPKFYYNDGQGNFTKTTSGKQIEPAPYWSVGNLNGDNVADIVTVGDGQGHVYINNGNGTFNKGGSALDGVSRGDVSLGDLNGDSHLDIAIEGDGKTQIYFNDGSGNFNSANSGISGLANGDVALGDLNGDSHIDIFRMGRDKDSELINTGYTVQDSLEQETTYYWRVRGYNQVDKAGEWSDSRAFTTKSETSGIQDENATSSFSIYPNPAADQLTIFHQENVKPQTFQLQTLTGKRLKTGWLSGTEIIDVSNLSPGVYLLQVQGEDAVRTKKVVVK